VRNARRIEHGGKRPQLVEVTVIALKVVALKYDRNVSERVFVAGHVTGTRLPKFGKKDVSGVKAGLDGRVEFAAAQDFAGIVAAMVSFGHIQ
jgi:hypothetical protein